MCPSCPRVCPRIRQKSALLIARFGALALKRHQRRAVLPENIHMDRRTGQFDGSYQSDCAASIRFAAPSCSGRVEKVIMSCPTVLRA